MVLASGVATLSQNSSADRAIITISTSGARERSGACFFLLRFCLVFAMLASINSAEAHKFHYFIIHAWMKRVKAVGVGLENCTELSKFRRDLFGRRGGTAALPQA